MTSLLSAKLAKLQHNVENIRNICILAHVDHGKTSLADSLVATNGVISARLAGKLRYMDSRKDEQERGITMKSSSISLFYIQDSKEYLINLMDSPGHVDFSSEVSTAVRLCDGAILVVDVVEGVQPQTKVVLKQAWDEGIKPVLVLNKVDRLVLEMRLDTVSAYQRLREVLEQVNALVAEMFTEEVLAKNSETQTAGEKELSEVFDWSSGLEEADDSNLYFSPELGNVVFCSAYDGWAFSIKTFASIYSTKLGFSERALTKALWGDYFVNKKTKKFCRGATATGKKPLFVSLILDNLWAVYEAGVVEPDKERLEKMIKALSLTVSARDLRSTDTRLQVSGVLSAWLPLAAAVLELVTSQLPSPNHLARERAEKLICSRTKRFSSLPAETQQLRQHFENCSASGPVIVFISKMFPVERSQLPQNKARPLTAAELSERKEAARARQAQREAGEEAGAVSLTGEQLEQLALRESQAAAGETSVAFVAFARVYSGTISPGQEVWVIGPKYDPALSGDLTEAGGEREVTAESHHISRCQLGSLYMLLGRDMESLQSVPAGNVVGISGLAGQVLKSATLSSTGWCPPFVPVHQSSVPILRVALEPALSSDLGKLRTGLKLLNQADAHVEVILSEAGEHILVTAGEVHLQRCLADLVEEFAKCEITMSDPIVPFRETIVLPPDTDRVNEAIEKVGESESVEERVELQTANKQSSITIKAVPLPAEVTKLLEDSADILKALDKQRGILTSSTMKEVERLKRDLEKHLDASETFKGSCDKIWSLGPKQCGPNLLINLTDYNSREVWPGSPPTRDGADKRAEMESSLVQGFQLATLAGPLCEEPMMGVAFLVESWQVLEDSEAEAGWGPLSGQIVSMVKDCCRESFLRHQVRLMTAMYACDIMVKTEVLGKMFSVVNKRRGKVVAEELIEGSSTFVVTAHIPVIESLNIGPELRKQTSGMAMPQLIFSHWEVLDIDPRWVPSTEEEYLHFGEKADSANPALKYMNDIRKRKGLKIDEKLVEFAEKQRTLTKSK